VFGVADAVIALTVGLGALVTPAIIGALGISGALVAIGALCPTAFAFGWRRLRALDEAMIGRDQEIALLRAVSLLEPLPMPTLEQLARQLEPASVRAGDAAVAQGDRGDRFYVIADGEAEVIRDGRLLARLGPGESFGEIALLRDVPHPATVRARTDLWLHALQGRHFLTAVTGYSASKANADIIARRRLSQRDQ
jgi:hypothetical protein